ncbi:MAG: biopolymer transport protein ExbD [Candidatus Azotimanducaceae bacterium]|jgi:biopolymer transport protein ExbD
MDRVRKRRQKHTEAADLDVTPFMNLMIVLVPVLLLSMVFTHTTVIDLNFPTGDAAGAFDPEAVHLEVAVYEDKLVVADGRGGVIKSVPRTDAGHNYAELTLVMQELKRRMPDKEDITVLLQEDTDYQTLVSVMDRVRSYATVQALEVVQAELFPVISLGDTPQSSVAASVSGKPEDQS